MRNERVQGAVLMIRRAAKSEAGGAGVFHFTAAPLHQTRFANARFATEQDHLPRAFLALLPAPMQQPDFFVATDQKERPRRGDVLIVRQLRLESQHPRERHRLGNAFKRMSAQVFQRKGIPRQPRRGRTQHERIGLSQSLQAGGDVGGLTQRQVLALLSAADLAHHDQPRVNADAHLEGVREAGSYSKWQPGIEGLESRQDLQPRAHRALGIVFMGGGIAEVD
jgi:hypothetical protein